MSLDFAQPRRALMNVVIAWAGDVIDALAPIAIIDRPAGYRDSGYRVDEPGFPDENDKLAGDDSPTLSRTIRWAGGRNTTLLWKLPSPGP